MAKYLIVDVMLIEAETAPPEDPAQVHVWVDVEGTPRGDVVKVLPLATLLGEPAEGMAWEPPSTE